MMSVKGFPHKQTFNVHPRRNLAKKKAWWQMGNTNNRKQSVKRED